MTARTYDELFTPQTILSLAKAPGGWIVWDQHCRYYVLAPHSLQFCLTFMRAMEARGHAVIDDMSVERACWEAAQHSVRVGALPEREQRGIDQSGSGSYVAAPAPDSRSESASNVVPIRKAAG